MLKQFVGLIPAFLLTSSRLETVAAFCGAPLSIPGRNVARPESPSSAPTTRLSAWTLPSIPDIFGGIAGDSEKKMGGGGVDRVREESKLALKRLVSRTNRGKGAGDAEREEIFAAMEALERMNPTESPADSALLGGKWSLLYTGASASDARRRREKEGAIGSALTELTGASDGGAGADESENSLSSSAPRGLGQALGEADDAPLPLGRRLTTLAKGTIVENRGNFQDIDVENGLVENRAEFALLGLPAVVRIQGRCERVPETDARLAVFFEKVELRLSSLAVTLPLTWANDGLGPEGWVDTTYLDSDLRCGRGDKGSFFIAARRLD